MKRLAVAGLVLVFVMTLLIGPAFAKPSQDNGNANKGNDKVTTSSTTEKSKAKKTTEPKMKVNQATQKTSEQEASDYTDTKGHWGSQAIKKAKALGLLKGYEDGSFKPDATLSTLEATVIAVRVAENLSSTDTTAAGTAGADTTTTTTDTSLPDWSKPSVEKAKTLKIININRFHSQVQVTRAQAAIMLAKALKLEPITSVESPFPDVGSLTAEDIGYLLALQQKGIIHGSPDGKFNPNSSLTRAEIAAMLANIADQAGTTEPGTGTTTGDTITATAN